MVSIRVTADEECRRRPLHQILDYVPNHSFAAHASPEESSWRGSPVRLAVLVHTALGCRATLAGGR